MVSLIFFVGHVGDIHFELPLNLVFFLNMVFFCHAYFHVSPELLQFLVNCREVKLIVAMLFGCFDSASGL